MFEFSVATLNTWHGLNGNGKLTFGSLETGSERMQRLRLQVSALRELSPTIIFLQEINPLPFRAHWYAKKLDKNCEHATCNAGVKLGWGPPYNLSEGLGILFPKDWKSEFLGKRKLSGSFRFSPFRISEVSTSFLSFQLHESRFAMAVRLYIPSHLREVMGCETLLCSVTHLHHAHALTSRNKVLLEEHKSLGMSLDEYQSILKIFQESNSRRVSEIEILGSWLNEIRLPGEPIILCGDFNSEPQTEPIEILKRKGWADLWEISKNENDPILSGTWCPLENTLAARSKDFQFVGSTVSQRAKDFFIEIDKLPRRIDYVFLNSDKKVNAKSSKSIFHREILEMKKFGLASAQSAFLSDHYGLHVKFKNI